MADAPGQLIPTRRIAAETFNKALELRNLVEKTNEILFWHGSQPVLQRRAPGNRRVNGIAKKVRRC
ncbi:hypothetical protein KR100_11105 [Synechococcus sp. KORDI-100]|nr:hypothetical protein KR100_11105 [Synechococcus sp. KORDI-100]